MADSPRRHFLPWSRPLLPQVVAWLIGGWRGGSPLDLANLLVIVPTRQSGRRLREALAEAAAGHGQAVFPPRVITPESLLVPDPAADIAPRLVSLLAWTEVFRGLDLEKFRDVFPVDPPARNFGWALRLAREFSRLQAALAEGGLRVGDVVKRAGPDFPETARWTALGELEARHSSRLAAAGLRDAQAAKIAAVRNPPPVTNVERIVVIATPDPLPMAIEALTNHARQAPIDVVVFAPDSEAGNFDAWGRPRESAPDRPVPESGGWGQREIILPDFDQQVWLGADPAAQAERMAEIARQYDRPAERVGLGVADPEILPWLENALGREGVTVFNPEGRARRHDALYALLAALAALAAEPDIESAASLLRCPDVLAWLRAREGFFFSPAVLLAQLDKLRTEHLPPTLAAAQRHAAVFPAVAPAFGALTELRGLLTSDAFPANAAAALATIFASRRIDAAGPLAGSAEAWTKILREVGDACAMLQGEKLDLAEAWNFALEEFAATTSTMERPAEAVDLLGWLELLWEDAPHLVVAGLNDGRVPDAVAGDAFLPEALRVRLGLKTNAARFARDAYLLTALAASRRDGGRLDLLLGKSAAVGDPLRPSRLLLRCADEDLPGRVARLFSPAEPARRNLPWSRTWRLRPRRVAPPDRVAVTALRNWLACPFRFYLRHALRMTRVDPDKAELDARDFGILLHGALQQLGENAALRDCADAKVLGEFLLERFEQVARVRYGTERTLPLVVQLESARQRLRAAAGGVARERAAGWRTERVEWPFSFPLGGLTLHGKIDRIDRHADGRVRVLDYKTGDKARGPAQSHLRPTRAVDAGQPGWLRCRTAEGRERIWADLQLPLYRRAVAAEWGEAVVCGYFNLPKATGGTAVVLWEDFARDLQSAAECCAENAAAAVAAGVFWPPAELPAREVEWDDFAELFHHGPADSVDFRGGDGPAARERKSGPVARTPGEVAG